MKKIVTILLVLVASKIVAQDIEIKKDVVFVDGKEFFKINGGAMSTNFSIENLEGKKIIFFKLDSENRNQNGTSSAIVTFAGYPQLRATYQPTIPFKKMIAKEVVQNDLVIEGQLSEENVYRYCNATMPINHSNNNVNININHNNSTQNFTPLSRNTDAPIFTNNNKIKQDFKEIGKYTSQTQTFNGKIQRTILISGYDNTKIAEVKYQKFSEEAELYLFNRNRTSYITIPNANDIQVLEGIIKYIIEIHEL